jgi:allantoin racemase
MRILIVNPNTTAAMTEKIGRAGRAAAALGTELIVVNPADGPVSIEGYYDEAFSVPGLLAEIAKGDTLGVSAHIIAFFDDTGLEAARSVALAPVIGIGEAAFHLASMLGHRFSVVTTLSRSFAAIENNLLKYRLAGRCGRVRASELPVLSLDDPSSDAAAQIGTEIELAKQEDRAEDRSPAWLTWPHVFRKGMGFPSSTGSQALSSWPKLSAHWVSKHRKSEPTRFRGRKLML